MRLALNDDWALLTFAIGYVVARSSLCCSCPSLFNVWVSLPSLHTPSQHALFTKEAFLCAGECEWTLCWLLRPLK